MRVTLLVAVAHALNDAYAAFLSPMLPRLMGRLGLSITLAAVLATAFSLASALLQPLAGYLADRYGRRIFVVAGPLLSGVFLSLIGVAPTFWILLLFLVLGGLGSAAFHPPGASFAAKVRKGRGSGKSFSYFSFAGAVGFALGPMLVVWLVARTGFEGMWIAMVPAILITPILWFGLPSGASERGANLPPGPGEVLRHLRGPLGLVFGISAVAAFMQRSYLTMTPIIGAAEGASEETGALALTFYLAGQAIGTLMGGWLTDRVDRPRLLRALTLLSLPAFVVAFMLPVGSPAGLAAAFLAGGLNMALLPPVVVLAQELIPSGRGLGAGIAMGLAWAAGAMGLLALGPLGDLLGARAASLSITPVLLLATGLALHPALRTTRTHPQS